MQRYLLAILSFALGAILSRTVSLEINLNTYTCDGFFVPMFLGKKITHKQFTQVALRNYRRLFRRQINLTERLYFGSVYVLIHDREEEFNS